MKTQELNQLSEKELQARLEGEERDLYVLRDNIMAGKEKNYKQLRRQKSVVARIKTIMRQKQDV